VENEKSPNEKGAVDEIANRKRTLAAAFIETAYTSTDIENAVAAEKKSDIRNNQCSFVDPDIA
jgi:hypothetical protein